MRGSSGGLPLIRELVASGRWVASRRHVAPRLEDGEFTNDDLESAVLTGKLHKRQRDEKRTAVDGNKYTIIGRATGGYGFYVAGKILRDEDGLFFFFIAAHRAR